MEFIDLKAQYERIKPQVRQRIDAVLEHGKFIMGPEVFELEERLARYVGVKHCISCSNGTDALLMPLMAQGIGPGDAVFTTAFSFIATAEVIALLGATPVFVDIDEQTFNIDPVKLEEAIVQIRSGQRPSPGSPEKLRPRGIIPVDLFGLPADYDAINAIAAKYDLFVLEDAAQSFGAIYKGKKAGSLATVAATSFFPAKPLGCYGDGGAIFTDDDQMAAVLRSIRVHGKGDDKYDNVRIGLNGRLDTIQAAVVLAKLDIFDEEFAVRQEVARRYSEGLKELVTVPFIPEGYQSAWAQYTVVHPNRQQIMDTLKLVGVPTMIYYPKPLHQQGAFLGLGYVKGCLPVAEKVAGEVFSLPMGPNLTEEELQTAIKSICT